MPDRGRPRIPTGLKLLQGERRESRLNRAAPRPEARRPVMPGNLSDGAQKIWRRIMRDFGGTEILTRVDLGMLRAYVEAEDRYVESSVLLTQAGPLARDRHRGGLVKNPLHQIVRDNAVLMRLFAHELGFSPSAREHLTIPEATEDTFEAWEGASRG